MKKRILSVVLSVCMMLSLLPPALFAQAASVNLALHAEVLGVSQSSPEGETAGGLFDDDRAGTKWCVGNNTGWVVFKIAAPSLIGKIRACHAGQSSHSWDASNAGNTKAYALQVFNGTGVPAESDFSDDGKWTTVGEETDNVESIKETAVTTTAPAQYFRLNVTDSGDPNTSKAVRFYELELFAPEPPEKKSIRPAALAIEGQTKKNDGNGEYCVPGSYIWFGKNNGTEPIRWRVLNAEQTNDGEAGIFLLSEELLSNSVYFDNTDPMRNAWQGSDAQSWCRDFAGESGTAVADALGSEERAALHPATKTDAAKTLFELNWAEGRLENDRVFFLSAEELYDYVGTYDDAPGMRNTENWWLRSPSGNSESGSAGALEDWVAARAVNTERGARPACNLNPASILFASAAEGGKPEDMGLSAIQSYTGNEWKLTLKDGSRSFAVTETKLSGYAGGSVTFNYTGARTGENEYISALLTDSADGLLYYGRLAQAAAETGSVTFTLPAGLAAGSYKLKLFNEQCCGDKKSDYASEPQEVALTAVETVTVTFDLNGYGQGPAPAPLVIGKGQTAAKPADPVPAEGDQVNAFGHWQFVGNSGWEAWDFSWPVTKDMTLRAFWIEWAAIGVQLVLDDEPYLNADVKIKDTASGTEYPVTSDVEGNYLKKLPWGNYECIVNGVSKTTFDLHNEAGGYDKYSYYYSTVKFDANGQTFAAGSAPETQIIENGACPKLPPTPSASDGSHAFHCWTVAPDADSAVYDFGVVRGPTTVYAQWVNVSGGAYPVTVYGAGISGPGTAEPNQDYAATLTPPSDEYVYPCSIEKIKVNGVEIAETSGNLAKNAQIIGVSKASPNEDETAGHAFDGDEHLTKWCADQGSDAGVWVAFKLGAAANITSLKVFHAGAGTNETVKNNAKAYELQILDETQCTEADFLAKSQAEQNAVMGNAVYWKNVSEVTGNTDDVRQSAVSMTGSRQVYRFHVTDAGEDRCVRIFEIELSNPIYTLDAATGALKINGSAVTGPIEIFAGMTVRPFRITYIANNGVEPAQSSTESYVFGREDGWYYNWPNVPPPFTAPADRPYFKGWALNADGSGVLYDDNAHSGNEPWYWISGDVTFYAVWWKGVDNVELTARPDGAPCAGSDTLNYFTVKVNGDRNVSQEVTWSLSGSTSAGTKVTPGSEGSEGYVFTVGSDETAEHITVRATSVADPEKYAELTVLIGFSVHITNGSVVLDDGTASADARRYRGDTVKIQANPAPDEQEFDYWKIVKGDITLADAHAGTTEFTMPTGNIELEAVYKALANTVTPKTATFDPNDSNGLYFRLASTINPDTPYYLLSGVTWTDADGNAVNLQDTEYEMHWGNAVLLTKDFLAAKAPGTYTVTFNMDEGNSPSATVVIPDTWKVSIVITPEDGGGIFANDSSSRLGEDIYYVTKGEEASFDAGENNGYIFLRWKLDGEIVGEDWRYTFTPTADCTLEAVFEAKRYALAITPAEKDFGSSKEGHIPPAAETFTVTNTGNQPLMLTSSGAAADYTVGEPVLANPDSPAFFPGDTMTFTVRPKAGLAIGTYSETIYVYGDAPYAPQPMSVSDDAGGDEPAHKAEAALTVNFRVVRNIPVYRYSAQVRFKWDPVTSGEVLDRFDFRLLSTIDGAKLDEWTTNGNKFVKVGFIAAEESAASGLAEAKTAVETGGGLPSGWHQANGTYVYRPAPTEDDPQPDGQFGARINGISRAALTQDIVCCAYAAYTDGGGGTHFVWYEEPYTARVFTKYDIALDVFKRLYSEPTPTPSA